jgi:hypothetical protein
MTLFLEFVNAFVFVNQSVANRILPGKVTYQLHRYGLAKKSIGYNRWHPVVVHKQQITSATDG